ncbi:MAG TPA: serine/threonine-protein kinase, partial [Solirubrobacteraceae bacterium]|nr:serine/threonine-protein kinase [Solirubrobacteraceae bacterium]
MTFSPSAAGSLPAAWKLLAMMRTRTRDTKPFSTISARRLDDLQSPPPGELVLGRYRLEERLGAGGFGIVWRARDERLHRAVAVKVIAHAGGPRARREALAAARLNHPGIVTLYEAGADGSADYLVSELIDGRTLAQLEADGALSDRDIAAIGIALCDALAHAHANGVVHRDVKPHNVMIPDQPREGELAKLTDFGVARLAGAEPLTGTSDIVGTRAYMAPEQAAGQALDERVDLYALGVVLYEALAGTHPARLTDTESLPPLGRVRRGLPRALTVAVDRAVAARADRRGTLDDLRDGLAAAFGRLAGTPGAIAPARVERR